MTFVDDVRIAETSQRRLMVDITARKEVFSRRSNVLSDGLLSRREDDRLFNTLDP